MHGMCRSLVDGHVLISDYKDRILDYLFKKVFYGFINKECFIRLKVRIGRYMMLAPDVLFIGSDHYSDKPSAGNVQRLTNSKGGNR